MNSEGHYLVVISVANYSDGHYILPQISLPGSDLLYSFFIVKNKVEHPWVLTHDTTGCTHIAMHNHQ